MTTHLTIHLSLADATSPGRAAEIRRLIAKAMPAFVVSMVDCGALSVGEVVVTDVTLEEPGPVVHNGGKSAAQWRAENLRGAEAVLRALDGVSNGAPSKSRSK
jgi:hypothetical protein